MRSRTLLLLAAVAGLVAACSNNDPLLIASVPNLVDTVTLGALRHTPLTTPSAYEMDIANAIRTDDPLHGAAFDFLYDIDSVQGPAFYPAEVAGILPHAATNPGSKRVSTPFASITLADLNGYTTDSIVPIDTGEVFMIRSRVSCGQGVPFYGKLAVNSIDSVAHTVTFLVMVDVNCGFRGLKPGLPGD